MYRPNYIHTSVKVLVVRHQHLNVMDGFFPMEVHVGFVLIKEPLEQVFTEYFSFLLFVTVSLSLTLSCALGLTSGISHSLGPPLQLHLWSGTWPNSQEEVTLHEISSHRYGYKYHF